MSSFQHANLADIIALSSRQHVRGCALKQLSGNDLEERIQNPLGHAPHHHVFHQEGGDHQGVAAHRHGRWPTCGRVCQARQLDPMGGGHFGVESQVQAGGKGKDERAHRDRWEDRSPWGHIVEGTYQRCPGEIDADLLGGFPDGRLDQVGVASAAATPWEPDLAGPGIAATLSPADEEDRKGVGSENEGDGSPSPVRLDRLDRLMSGEAVGDAGQRGGERLAQWLCEWHAPPQQPPGGGPSLLKSAGLPPVAGRAGSDMRRSTFRSLHSGQLTVVPFRTSRSKSEPQEGQW